MNGIKPKKKHDGKIFEKDFIESFPESWYTHRFHDSAGSWQGGEGARFTPSSICDFLVYHDGALFFLELKSHKGNSIPFSCIREKQLEGLIKAGNKGVIAGIVFNFRDTLETFYVPILTVNNYILNNERKSFPLSYLRIDGIKINQSVKHRGTHQTYDVEKIFM